MNTQPPPYSNPTYDPLAAQFMTQGQMGYMPQAQFLTSADYGAYRTLPGMQMGSNSNQNMSMWQAYIQSRRGNLLGVTGNYMAGMYNPLQSQTINTVMAQRQFSDKTMSAGVSAAGLGIDMALPMLGAAALGLPGGLIGMGAAALLPNVGDMLNERRRQARGIQNISMPAITTGPEMSTTLGQGFTLGASAKLNQSLRKEAVDDFSFNQEDYQGFLRSGVQSGLMDYSASSTQYADTIKILRGNVKLLKELFENKDIAGIFEDMQRMQTMGASTKDMQRIGMKESLFARAAGLSQEKMVATYGQQGAMQFTQRGMTGYVGSLQAMGQAAAVTMAQRTGLIDAGELSRAGGKSGLTQRLTEGDSYAHLKFMDQILPGLLDENNEVDKAKLAKFQSGELSVEDAVRGGMAHLGTSREITGEWLKKKYKLLEDVQKSGNMDLNVLRMAETIGRQAFPDADEETQLFHGFKAYGYDEQASRFMSAQWGSPEGKKAKLDQEKIQQRMHLDTVKQEQLNKTKLFSRASLWGRTIAHNVGTYMFGGWDARQSRKADREEQERVGVYSSVFDMQDTLSGGTSLSKEQQDEVNRGISKSIDWDTGTIKERRKKVDFKNAFLQSAEGLDDTAKEDAEKALKLDKGVLQKVVATMGAQDISHKGYVKALMDAGKNKKEAEALVKDKTVTDYISWQASQNKKLPGRVKSQVDLESAYLRWELGKSGFKPQDIAFRNEFLDSEGLSGEEESAAIQDIGVPGVKLNKVMQGISAKDVNEKGFTQKLMNLTGKNQKDAQELLHANDNRVMRLMANRALQGDSLLGTRVEEINDTAREDYAKKMVGIVDAAHKDAYDAMGKVGGDKDTADLLRSLSKETSDPNGKESILSLFAVRAAINLGKEGSGGLDTLYALDKDKMSQIARDLDIAPEELKTELYDGGDLWLQPIAEKLGLKGESYKKFMEGTTETGDSSMDVRRILRDIEPAQDKLQKSRATAGAIDMRTTLMGGLLEQGYAPESYDALFTDSGERNKAMGQLKKGSEAHTLLSFVDGLQRKGSEAHTMLSFGDAMYGKVDLKKQWSQSEILDAAIDAKIVDGKVSLEKSGGRVAFGASEEDKKVAEQQRKAIEGLSGATGGMKEAVVKLGQIVEAAHRYLVGKQTNINYLNAPWGTK